MIVLDFTFKYINAKKEEKFITVKALNQDQAIRTLIFMERAGLMPKE